MKRLKIMGSSPSKKVSQFTIKDAIPLRFDNNNDDFQATNLNGTVIKGLDNRNDAGVDFTDQGVRITQPQETQSLPYHQGKTGGVTKRTLPFVFSFHCS